MLTDILQRFEAIEESYEFMLAYAAQGLATDQGSRKGRELREFLSRAAKALSGLAGSCATAIREENLEKRKLMEFLVVLDRDARDSMAAMELVLEQPAISSQLVDNLNASMHVRAMLADIFLLGEVFRSQAAARETTSMVS
jgi:hypothetical protein